MRDNVLKQLCQIYDKGRLVPFIGSGMSIPICVNWASFVDNIESAYPCYSDPDRINLDLVKRAYFAMRNLRSSGVDVAEHIRSAVYNDMNPKTDAPRQTQALARLYWPLVCTTNYDDIYLRARQKQARNNSTIFVYGRSDSDCRKVLNHMQFPTCEVVWALQGFVRPVGELQPKVPDEVVEALRQEIVVGHAEYRAVTNREPHFRRSFGELFRSSSFLFLGCGLAEPYFLSLFDEIIELVGPPVRPHFAMSEQGTFDADFLRQNYNIECIPYAKGNHVEVSKGLEALSRTVLSERARSSSWGFRIAEPQQVDWTGAIEDFKVVRAELPEPASLPPKHCLAISCGRSGDAVKVNPELERKLKLYQGFPHLTGDQVVQVSRDYENVYGIIAREGRRDQRSPRVIRAVFTMALDVFNCLGVGTVHVQLLAAGPGRNFRPWISIVQMARAYGEWFRTSTGNRMAVRLYVVDPSVIALLQGSHLDLAEHLEGTDSRINIEVRPTVGVVRHQRLISADEPLGTLTRGLWTREDVPRVSVEPAVTHDGCTVHTLKEAKARNSTVEDIGLVSGSTLILDYPKRGSGGNQ